MNTKTCYNCQKDKSLDNYRPRSSKNSKLRGTCKACEAEWAKKNKKEKPERWAKNKKAYYERHPEASQRERRRTKVRKWGLNPDEVCKYLDNHNKKCDICGRNEEEAGTLHIDHDHITSNIRGMLCGNCNCGIGQLKDSKELLQKAIEYLQKEPIIKRQN